MRPGPTALDNDSRPRDLLALGGSFFFIFMGSATLQQFAIPFLKDVRGWSEARCYWILPTVYFSQAFWRINAVYVINLIGNRAAIILGALTYLLFAGGLLLCPNYPLLLAILLAWGLGASLLWSAGSTQAIQAAHHTRYGQTAGLLYASVDFGFLIGVVVLTLVYARLGPGMLWAFCLPCAGLGVLATPLIPRRHLKAERQTLGNLRDILVSPWAIAVCILLLFCSFAWGIMLGSLPDWVKQEHGIGSFFALLPFYLGRLSTDLLGGRLSDSKGRGKVLFGAFLLSAAGMLSVSIWHRHLASILVGTAALGILFSAVPFTTLARIGDLVEPSKRQIAYGAIFIWRDLGVGISVLAGLYLRNLLGGFQMLFLFFSILFFLLSLLSFQVGRGTKLPAEVTK